jgi:hypothetical protein
MTFLEKLGVKCAQATTSVLMIGGSMSLFYFFLSVAKSHISTYASTIGKTFGFAYAAIGFSALATIFYVIILFDNNYYRSFDEGLKKNQDGLFKFLSLVFMANVLINCVVPGFYNENYFTSLTHYAPFALSNFGMVMCLAFVALTAKFYFSFDKAYFFVKNKIKTYFDNKNHEKEANKAKLKIDNEIAQGIKPSNTLQSMTIFSLIEKTIPSQNKDFLDCLNSLKQTVLELSKNSTDIEVENEMNILLEQNLPKIANLYLSTDNQEDKKEVLTTFTQMDNYFKNLQNELNNKKSFKNNLNLKSELKYMSEKYGA